MKHTANSTDKTRQAPQVVEPTQKNQEPHSAGSDPTWASLHQQSTTLAVEAQAVFHDFPERGRRLYALAAILETDAIALLDLTKKRTIGIISISAVSLWIKAGESVRAQELSRQILGQHNLPDFAIEKLRLVAYGGLLADFLSPDAPEPYSTYGRVIHPVSDLEGNDQRERDDLRLEGE